MKYLLLLKMKIYVVLPILIDQAYHNKVKCLAKMVPCGNKSPHYNRTAEKKKYDLPAGRSVDKGVQGVSLVPGPESPHVLNKRSITKVATCGFFSTCWISLWWIHALYVQTVFLKTFYAPKSFHKLPLLCHRICITHE